MPEQKNPPAPESQPGLVPAAAEQPNNAPGADGLTDAPQAAVEPAAGGVPAAGPAPAAAELTSVAPTAPTAMTAQPTAREQPAPQAPPRHARTVTGRVISAKMDKSIVVAG